MPASRNHSRKPFSHSKDYESNSFIADNAPSLSFASTKRRARRQLSKENSMVCYGCRKSGHSVKKCPSASATNKTICYRCGSFAHRLEACPEKPDPQQSLPYALCFYCNQKGHLSGQCSQNEKGLYPNGGGCKYCGSVRHYAHQCKELTGELNTLGLLDLTQGTGDDDVFISTTEENDKNKPQETHQKVKKKLVTF